MEYGNPSVFTACVSMARCAPFSLTTIPMISTSSGGSSSFNTSSESDIWGTAFGDTNETASMCLNPALISACKYVRLMSDGICPFSPCQASRGHSISFMESALSIQFLAFSQNRQRKHDRSDYSPAAGGCTALDQVVDCRLQSKINHSVYPAESCLQHSHFELG